MRVDTLQEIYEYLYYGLGIAELGIAGTMLLITVIGAIVSFIISCVVAVIFWIVESIPVYKLAKKLGYKRAILAWIPILGDYFRLYVLVNMVGDKPFELFGGKIRFRNRALTFWFHVGIIWFGRALITAVLAIVSVLPIVGQVVAAISPAIWYLLPQAAVGLLEFVYLRDVLDAFKADKKTNRIAAIVVTVLDCLVTFGLARAVYLYTLLKHNPLPPEVENIE